MTRPGPRPYECVRRAWHSDRHQPIRGSLIQEIFRMASQVHKPDTQKNKEWQEKLPFVVLKAEEVMYSKANSEAEYMDLKTLCERTNDAIDTIIRRDDAPETEGDLLLPCIEAALNLGCVPRRASRSQRHNNPCCYLSSTTGGESTTAAAASFLKLPDINTVVGKHLGSSTCSLPRPPPTLYPGSATIPFSSQFEPWTAAGINHSDSNVISLVPDAGFGSKDPISISAPSPDTLVPWQSTVGLSVPVGTYTWPRFGCVYPLYYNDEQPNPSTHLPFLKPPEPSTSATPVPCPSICGAGMDFLHNFLRVDNAAGASNTSSNFGEGSENRPGVECDLSLRLGLSPPPSLDAESVWTREVEDAGSSSSCDNGSRFSCQSLSRTRVVNFGSSFSSSKDKGCDFFPVGATDDPLESCSSQRSSGRFGCF